MGARAMQSLNAKAFLGLLQLIVATGLAVFLPAWTVDWWQAWVFLGVFFLGVLAITLYLMKKDPKLLERRVKAGPIAEKQTGQKVVQGVASLAFVALFVVAGFDHRLGWSVVPTPVVWAGDVLVALGLGAVFFVFRENTFASATIEVGAEQKVVASGPYARVRHPMYSGGLVLLLGVPVALGSWRGLWAVIPLALVIVWRLLDEEKLLTKDLAGYAEYRNRVRHRLVPFVW
jgi:protein-S-isoprenylcysteine O-methyltransferase Ste14